MSVTTMAAHPQVEQIVDAVRQNNAGMVARLLEENEDLLHARDNCGESLPLLAAYYESAAVAKLLVQRGIVLDIFEAVSLGEKQRAFALLNQEPAPVNSYGSDGWMPLHLAAHFGHRDLVEELLLRGAEIDGVSQNPCRQTPLHSAVSALQTDIAKYLIANGADVNRRAAAGWTALHMAVHEGADELVELLINAGACINAPRSDGATPFMTALLAGHRNLVLFLHEHGATRWG